MELFIPIFILVLVVAVVASIVARSRRRKELSAWAVQHGLRFNASPDNRMDDRHKDMKCLHQGSSRCAFNVMRGQWAGRSIEAFDYRYTTGSGKNRQTHLISAVILHSAVPLKPLYIRREHFFDKVGEFLGIDDIDFESAEFSRTFHVKSPDRRWAFDVIHARMMQYLMDGPKLSIQFSRDCMIVWGGKTFKPPQFTIAAEFAQGILDLLPDYLVQQQMAGSR